MNAPVHEGDVLAGKYRVERVLGVGGMGVVVAARHLQLDERVALKFLLPELVENREAVARFSREARAAVRIKSEHVARVADVGTLDSGAPYMVMEYLDGSDLSAWLAQQGALAIEQAVEFVLQACEAIAEAHTLGIVHRDLKPSNLFVIRRPDGALSVKVLDFGISKITGASGGGPDAAMTQTSALLGSPLYMSPEQIRSSRDVDSRADIWAIGVILYELVAGRTPFAGEAMHEVLYKIVSDAPSPLRGVRPDVPQELEAVVQRCLEKDRARRYESVGELSMALLPFGSKRSRSSVERISGVMRAAGLSGTAQLPPSSSSPTEEGPQTATAASWGRTASRPQPGRSRLITGGAVAGAIAAIGLAYGKISISPDAGHATAASSLRGASASPSVALVPPRVPATVAASVRVAEPFVLPVPSASTPSPETTPPQAPIRGASKRKSEPRRAVSPLDVVPPSTSSAAAPATAPSAPPARRATVYDERK